METCVLKNNLNIKLNVYYLLFHYFFFVLFLHFLNWRWTYCRRQGSIRLILLPLFKPYKFIFSCYVKKKPQTTSRNPNTLKDLSLDCQVKIPNVSELENEGLLSSAYDTYMLAVTRWHIIFTFSLLNM